MTSIIQTSVLRAAVLSAFDRSRYTVTFTTTPAGDDLAVVPASIVLDLGERDDDLFGAVVLDGPISQAEKDALSEKWKRGDFSCDDHGPAVPAQDGHGCRGEDLSSPKVYEFAFQDAVPHYGFFPAELIDVTQNHAPDYVAASNADWVHVYDRVTRERRTLKRPGADRIVRGLADVAADLRADATAARAQGKSAALSDAVEAVLGDNLTMRRAAVEAGYASLEDYVEAPAPAPGPLTSAERLVKGDVLRVTTPGIAAHFGPIVSFERYAGDIIRAEGLDYHVSHFSFVGRPDSDGWMDWPGGQNPAPGRRVKVALRSGETMEASTDPLRWFHDGYGQDIVLFRLVDMPALPSDQ